MKRFESMQRGWEWINLGVNVYPLAANTKVPLAGTHGWRSATNDQAAFHDYFNNGQQMQPLLNLGVDLFHAGLMVVDVDINHDGKGTNGQHEFMAYIKSHGYQMPQAAYSEWTPNGGVHLFYRLAEPLQTPKRQTGIIPGVDLLGDQTVVAPSTINGKQYKPNNPLTSLDQLTVAPQWLTDLLINGNQPQKALDRATIGNSYINRRDTFTSRTLVELLQGTAKGNRNTWLTKMAGKLFRICNDPATVYQMMIDINRLHISPSLDQKEVDSIFTSILSRVQAN